MLNLKRRIENFSEEVLLQRAVKTTIQILYHEGLFDKYGNADEILKDYLFGEKRKPDLEEVNDHIE